MNTDEAIDLVAEVNRGRVQLVLYYLPFDVFTRAPLRPQDLVRRRHHFRIIAYSEALTPHIEQISELRRLPLRRVEVPTTNARLHAVFKVGDRDVYSFTLSAGKDMLVNGDGYEKDSHFYRFVRYRRRTDFDPFAG